MNILYIHSHDTGRYVQPYGYAIPTPNLQRLAEQGMLFRKAFCAAPTCSPSRAALLSGQSPHNAGMLGLAHRGFRMTDYRQHLAQTLRRAGYLTVLSGVQHEARRADDIGYDRILTTNAAEPHARAIEFLREKPKQPFFLSCGFFEIHREYPEPDDDSDPRYCAPPPPLPDTPETRADMAAYRTMARRLDEKIGAVLNALEETGHARNTFVLCTTDHGPAFPAMKCNLTDYGTLVMLMLRGPGGFEGGKVSDALVSHIDLYPTLCELAGIPTPEWVQGKSLLPLARDEEEAINEEVYSEVTYHAAYEPQRAVRTTRWKYIRRFGERTAPVLPNCDDSPGKTLWLEHGWKTRPVPREQLYDLIFDPGEFHSLTDDPAYRDTLEEMRGRLDRWMRRTDDPLLLGDVPLPPGAHYNDPDGISPKETPLTAPE